jgi:hypothetical protein
MKEACELHPAFQCGEDDVGGRKKSAQPAIPSADPFESILKRMRTPGKRSKIEPFNLVNLSSK